MHTIFGKFICLTLVCSLVFGCALDWPYYEPDVFGGIQTRVSKRAIEIPIRENVSIMILAPCHPRNRTEKEGHPAGYQHCHITIYRFGSASTVLNFESSRFVVQDLSNAGIRFDAGVSRELNFVTESTLRPGEVSRNVLSVELSYEMLPKQFRLQMPALMIDGVPHKVPEIIFTQKENTEFVLNY